MDDGSVEQHQVRGKAVWDSPLRKSNRIGNKVFEKSSIYTYMIKCRRVLVWIEQPSHGAPQSEITGFGGIGCASGHFEEYIAEIDVSLFRYKN